jgi:phenylacetate-coenzyme A ligase PaaK-like adenylate-forming protein
VSGPLRAIARPWRKLRGNAVIAAHLPGQREVPFLPRERLEALRDRRIRRLVAYAAETVPYYRDWFARSGVDPREIAGARDLERLPVLEKELVRARPELFVAESRAAKGALAFRTSGSTGAPIEIRHDRRSLLANLAFGERERQPVIRSCGGSFRPREIYVGYETSTFKKVVAFYDASTLLPVRPARRFVSLLEPIETIAALVNAERPDVLVGYGGWMALFFRTVAARGLPLHPPKLALYMGEALPHGARAQIEGTFGIPVLSRYNAVEAFKIGFFCEERTGFHLHEDLCHVRIAGPDGRQVPAGTQGEVVITNLVNRGTVLLNYPLGDLASLSQAHCPCGRTSALLSELEGRVEDILPLADGRFLHPRAVWQVLKDDPSVLQYQLTQEEPRRFTLTLTTMDEASFRAAAGRALPRLERLLGPGAVIGPLWDGALPRRDERKFRAVVSRCKPPAAV